jgi:hypothetical protein
VDSALVYLDSVEVGAVFKVMAGSHEVYEYRGQPLGAYKIEWLSCSSKAELEARLQESVRVSNQKIRAWRARKGKETGLAFARAHVTARAIRDHEEERTEQRAPSERAAGGRGITRRKPASDAEQR